MHARLRQLWTDMRVNDDLIKRLRRAVQCWHNITFGNRELLTKCADALEAAQQRIAELERTSQYAYSIKRAIQEARLAGLRDALEAVLEAVQKKPWLDVGVDKVIQALIDAAEKPSA